MFTNVMIKGNQLYDSFNLPVQQPNLEVTQVLQHGQNDKHLKKLEIISDGFSVSLLWETLKSTSCNTIICIHHLQLYWLCHQTSQWYFVFIKQVFVFLKATHMWGGVHLFFWGNWTSLTESQINKQLTDSSEGFGASEINKFYRSFSSI